MNPENHELYSIIKEIHSAVVECLDDMDESDIPVRIGLIPDSLQTGISLFYSDLEGGSISKPDQVIVHILGKNLKNDLLFDFIFMTALRDRLYDKSIRQYVSIYQHIDDKGGNITVLTYRSAYYGRGC